MWLATDGHDTRWCGGKCRRDGDTNDGPCHQIMKRVEGSASKVEDSPGEDGTADLATCNGGASDDRTIRCRGRRSP